MSEADLNIFGKLREKNNRPRIYAYTFLNPHGKAIDALDRMAKTAESAYDLKKICSWI